MSTTDKGGGEASGASSSLNKAKQAAGKRPLVKEPEAKESEVEVMEEKSQKNDVTTDRGFPKDYNPLINKEIRVRPVPHHNNGITNNVSESTMFMNTSRSIMLTLTLDNVYINPFRSDEERSFLEHKLGKDLNPLKEDNNYFDSLRINVNKTSEDLDSVYTTLNLSDPRDYLKYLVCLADPEVENGKKEIYHPDKVFYLEDIEEVTNDEFKVEDMKDKIYGFRMKLKQDEVKLRKFLMVYFFKYTSSSRRFTKSDSFQFLYTELGKLIEDSIHYKSLIELIDEAEEDPKRFELEYTALEGINIGEILKNVEGYFSKNGDYLGSHLDGIVSTLGSPKFRQVYERIRNQIENQVR